MGSSEHTQPLNQALNFLGKPGAPPARPSVAHRTLCHCMHPRVGVEALSPFGGEGDVARAALRQPGRECQAEAAQAAGDQVGALGARLELGLHLAPRQLSHGHRWSNTA